MSYFLKSSDPMKLNSVLSRPFLIFFLPAIGVLLLPSVVIPWWYNIIQQIKHIVDLNARMVHSGTLSEIENTAKLLYPMNSSATNLAKILSSPLNGNNLSHIDIENKGGPILFQTFSVIPRLSQISYFGLDGSFLAYYRDGNKTYAMYSNSTTASSDSRPYNLPINYTWFKQAVDPDTGKLYGNAIESKFNILTNASWIQEALTSGNSYASLGNGWNSAQDLLLLNSVSILGQGVISLGFPVNGLIGFFNAIDLHGGSFYLATLKGDVLANGLPNVQMMITGKSVSFNSVDLNYDQIGYIGNVPCIRNNRLPSIVNIGETKYMAYCSQLEIIGLKLAYVLAFPCYGQASTIQRSTRMALILLLVMIAAVFLSILSFVMLLGRAASREIHLCSALINQMEATQQAERKSMNKSVAFASASHDIRAALAGITGLIEISLRGVSPRELQTNLQQMNDCAKDLVGLLNSILDTSKIEAGKMHVESEEFDLATLLEDVVDMFHPVGKKKGIDVVLDPCDGSVLKFSSVIGDAGKLKQVLCNLLSNAVKFTSEGHVLVRAWARKPTLENKIIASSKKGLWKYCSCWVMEHNEKIDGKTMKQSMNSMEFVFEVDDTGTGIPKDKQKSVFENFVQVKETALGQGGTGLGLGIVQSLVRLMGGEIGIVDKENNEKGTCFRFNIFLYTSEISSTSNTTGDIEMGDLSSRLTVRAPSTPSPTRSLTSRTASPQLSILGSDASHVVLLIQNFERRRIVRNYIQTLGIKVSIVSKWERLSCMLTNIKSKLHFPVCTSSANSDFGSRNEIPMSALDGAEQISAYHRSSRILKGGSSFILLVIDSNAGPFEELHRAVIEFKRGLSSACCKVVWLDKPNLVGITSGGFEDGMDDSDDEIWLKPLHGYRLHQLVRFLPEFGANLHNAIVSFKYKNGSTIRAREVVNDPGSSSAVHKHDRKRTGTHCHQHSLRKGDIGVEGCSKREKDNTAQYYPERRDLVGSSVREKGKYKKQTSYKPLNGLRFLVAEDTEPLRRIAEKILSQLGAFVIHCQNGEQALKLVRCGLQHQRQNGDYHLAPYDYILMDCEMPVMNGYEATRQIRVEESSFDIHIPIIALTADDDKGKKAKEAGMDHYLCKPLRIDKLLEVIGIKTAT